MARFTLSTLFLFLLAATARPAAPDLANSQSAFLRANADSLVTWMQWGEPAFARAKAEQKPVFLAIGSFTSELSRAMSRQSFANADTAALLNANFVCILVDREEHPEVAALYLTYIRTVKQLDGAPLNLWLTPDLKPFEGAAYLPPSEEWGKSSFLKATNQALEAWKADANACAKRAIEAVALVAEPAPTLPATPVTPDKIRQRLTAATAAWTATADATHGGFGDAPKNPEPELIRFLLRQAPADRELALTTLRAMATSALRDPLDGGFFRSSSDPAWHIPYQQKILADQARVALAYLDAAQSANEPLFTEAARGALDYALTRLALPDGTFAAGEDATADEFAGYYAWTDAEIKTTLGADAAAFEQAHGALAAGNLTTDEDPSNRFKEKNLLRGSAAADSAVALRLRTARDHRPAPPRDERATAGAQGLFIASLARAGQQLKDPHYTAAASQLFEALKKQLMVNSSGELHRLRGSNFPAAPADYAGLALGFRELAKATQRPEIDALATKLLMRAAEIYLDSKSGRFWSAPAELPTGIFARVPAVNDVPAAESLAVLAGASNPVLKAALVNQIDDNGTPVGGDVLLALAP